jgi:hypothetical protein
MNEIFIVAITVLSIYAIVVALHADEDREND